MPVGKGSLTRAAKINETVEKMPKKTQNQDKKVAKFEAISRITCDLPIYLL